MTSVVEEVVLNDIILKCELYYGRTHFPFSDTYSSQL